MKKILIAAISLTALCTPVLALAAPHKLSPKYQAVYCYDTGTYWQKQKSYFPDYYAANDAYYRATFGPGTVYCPN